MIGVGGTYLETRDDGSYLRETGWQDYLTTGGTGGGISPVDPMPAWQVGPGVQNDRSNGNRQCPDVSAVADPDTGYLIFVTDQATGEAGWQMIGGTSAAAPALGRHPGADAAGRGGPGHRRARVHGAPLLPDRRESSRGRSAT